MYATTSCHLSSVTGGLLVGGKSPLAALVEGSVGILLLEAAPKLECLGIKSASFTKVGCVSRGSESLKPASSVNIAHDRLVLRINILKGGNMNAQNLDLLQLLPSIVRMHCHRLEASDVKIKGYVNVILRTPKEHGVKYWVIELSQDVRELIDNIARTWLFLAAEQVFENAHNSLYFLPNSSVLNDRSDLGRVNRPDGYLGKRRLT